MTIGYDANGNLAMQGTDSYTYDAENHIKTRTVGIQTATYTYDGGGNLLKRVNGDGTSTVYIGGAFEKNFNAQGAATGTTKYYSGMGRPFAYRTAGSGGGTGTLQWILADHLGSTTGFVDASGALVSSTKYWPYGAVRSTSGTLGTDKLFTGRRQEASPPDSVLGLSNYHARFYSSTLGRFVSPDPNSNDGLNRYSYVADNPVGATDPSGLYLLALCGWHMHCDRGAASNDMDWGDLNDWRNLLIQYWKKTGRFGAADLDVVFNLFVAAKLTGAGDDAIVNTFDADIKDTSHGGQSRDAAGSAHALEDFIHSIWKATGQPVTYMAGFSWGGATTNEFLYAAYKGGRDGIDTVGLDLKGVLYIGAPRIHRGGVLGLIQQGVEGAGAYSTLGADGNFNLKKLGINVVARSSPYYQGTTNTFGLLGGEIDGGANIKGDDARALGVCEHCIWDQSLWWDARDLFGLTD